MGPRPLSPEKILRSVVASARRSARKWGGGRKPEVPNRYNVKVSDEDWDAFFASRKEDVELRVGELASRSIADAEYFIARPLVVELSSCGDLELGSVVVEAVFDDPQPDEATAADKSASARPYQKHAPDYAEQSPEHNNSADGGSQQLC